MTFELWRENKHGTYRPSSGDRNLEVVTDISSHMTSKFSPLHIPMLWGSSLRTQLNYGYVFISPSSSSTTGALPAHGPRHRLCSDHHLIYDQGKPVESADRVGE